MNDTPSRVVLCNGADLPKKLDGKRVLRLDYRNLAGSSQNVKVSLPNFVQNFNYLPPRILDLLEIAAYVFAADRLESRGKKDAVEYHSWSRSFHFAVKVRDIEFWQQPTVQERLGAALCFMSGDREYKFTFQPGHSTPQTGLFDREEFKVVPPEGKISVVLFSGGLDSLSGVIDQLENSTGLLCLVSHRSQPGIKRTQNQLVKTLDKLYPERVKHYKFDCSLKGMRAIEETQRTRAFLYTSIAYSLCNVFSLQRFLVYENGVTALNFPKRQDQMNARASRTTHPKTIALLEDFFSEVEESRIKIETPFFWKTKTDVFQILKELGRVDLVTSTVSCSKTFQHLGEATHCGGCSQCVDRRFAAYASGSDDIDESGIYAFDFYP